MHALKPSDVIKLRKKLETRLAPRTIKQMEITLKAAMNDGAEHGVISSNPLQFLKTKSLELVEKKDVAVFEPEEQKSLIQAAREYAKQLDPRWFLKVLLGLHTGMRRGELYALQWKHIDLEAKQIRVEQSLEYSQGDTKGRLKAPKSTAGKRIISITTMLCAELKKY